MDIILATLDNEDGGEWLAKHPNSLKFSIRTLLLNFLVIRKTWENSID